MTFEREAVFFPWAGGEKPKSLHFKGIFVARSAPSSPSFTPPREREREKLRDFVDVFFVRSVYTSAAGTQNRRCLFETFLLLNGDVNTNTDIILIIVFEGVVHVEKKTAKNNREKNEQRDDVGAHDERYGCW